MSKLLPLESNPDVMNKYLQKLGVPPNWHMVDVMGLDPEVLAWVPRPVLAVLLLFPCSEKYEEFKKKEESEILDKGQVLSNDVFYLKQKLSNACGTIALVHSIANNTDVIDLQDGLMKKFVTEAAGLDPEDKGSLLENSQEIIAAHTDLAQEGQTETPNADDFVNHHFITFIHKDGAMYELDGRKSFPINHGPTSTDTLLEDAAKVCRDYMARDPDEVRFTIVAFTAAAD